MTLIPCCINNGRYINKDGTVDYELYNETLKKTFKEFMETTDKFIKERKFNRLKMYFFEINYKDICLNSKHYKND